MYINAYRKCIYKCTKMYTHINEHRRTHIKGVYINVY